MFCTFKFRLQENILAFFCLSTILALATLSKIWANPPPPHLLVTLDATEKVLKFNAIQENPQKQLSEKCFFATFCLECQISPLYMIILAIVFLHSPFLSSPL
jgi:hypothetical protein